MSGINIIIFGEVLSAEKKEYTNKDGEKKTFNNVTIYDPVSGSVASFGCESETLVDECTTLKRCYCQFDALYNPTYKSIRVTSVKECDDEC